MLVGYGDAIVDDSRREITGGHRVIFC